MSDSDSDSLSWRDEDSDERLKIFTQGRHAKISVVFADQHMPLWPVTTNLHICHWCGLAVNNLNYMTYLPASNDFVFHCDSNCKNLADCFRALKIKQCQYCQESKVKFNENVGGDSYYACSACGWVKPI